MRVPAHMVQSVSIARSWGLVIRRGSLILRCGGSLAAILVVLTCAVTPSFAGWSAPRFISGPAFLAELTIPHGPLPFATDARGDVAIAWPEFRPVGHPPNWWYDSSVRLASAGPTGRIVTRTVWRHAHSLIASVTVVLDAHGELTVAWIEAPSPSGSPFTVRARYRSASGRWSAPQVVGRSRTAFYYARPELAVAPNGEVLLTWNAGSTVGVDAAWRSPGHPFRAASLVSHSQRALIFDPTPVFDPSGAAHVYGTNVTSAPRPAPPKPPPRTRGVMLSTRAHSHRFGAPVIVGPPAADALVVSFSTGTQALAAWLREPYPYDAESPLGTPYARVMLHGSWKTPVALEPHSEGSLVTAAGRNGGGGGVGWLVTSPGGYSPRGAMTATADATGHFSASTAPASGLVPVARDGAGDVVLQDIVLPEDLKLGITPSGPITASPVVDPVTRGAPEPSPLAPFVGGTPLTLSESVFATAESPTGRRVALVWLNGLTGRVGVSTWRP